MSDEIELMGMRVRCQCGMKMIAPVDWTDLQGFVLIYTLGVPIVTFLIKQEWWLWVRWIGFVGLTLLFVFMFWALPRTGHESAITSLLRSHIVGSVVLALTALSGLFYEEATSIIQFFEYLPEISGALGSFFFIATLDLVSFGWFARLAFDIHMHLFAMVRYAGLYFAPIGIMLGTILFVQVPYDFVKAIGVIFIAIGIIILLKPRPIKSVQMLTNEILDFDFMPQAE